MKATKPQLMKAAELGILRSIEDFLLEPLKPGRLKRKFMEVSLIIDGELRNIYRNNESFFTDNKDELAELLTEFGKISEWGNSKEGIHVTSVVSFCLAFLEVSKSKYTPKLIEHLTEILSYYERANNLNFEDMWTGKMINEKWDNLKKTSK
ncbi:MAG: hypothetical protein DRJ07_03335 [Bacteroidetes bacterium]|nr:MAG: hypothetical protein DRJ07_03335 [Bacteroidota bacterium]